MPRPFSEDLRKRIVMKRDEGYSEADISQMFDVSTSSVYRLCKRQREHGHIRPEKMRQPEGSSLDPHKERIGGWINKEHGITLEEIVVRLADELDIHIHHTTVMRALPKWGYRYKKTLYPREQNLTDVQEKRTLWRTLQQCWDAHKLVFIDDYSINTKMTRLYGRSLASERCIDYAPHGHWHTNTFIAGLRHDRITAPILFGGPMNATTFLQYIE